MRSVLPAIPLLAFCHLSLASRCRPYSSSVTSILSSSTSEPSETESAPSTTLPSTTLLVETDSSTTLSYSTTLSEDGSTSESATSSIESTSITSEAESVTSDSSIISTTLATTTSLEPSTTTSSSVSQGPTNLILNPGLEDSDTITPWIRLGTYGTVSLSTTEFHSGSQSGYFTGAPGGPANMGFRQNIDSSLLEADKQYRFSVYVKIASLSSCFGTFVACGTGDAYFNTGGFGGIGAWTLATVTCSWTQARLDAGANVRVQGTCERLSFYMDDATLEEVVA
ncbi:hypothetical protein CEP54_014240 [Fusarium duplospermum]|uniref:CBM-cenC domain-containing protein n=1 Tax=Fusarium duplospermum TaxID=1325734 RepID=A0A428NXS9_9HYPO|nr:hypothetical protein CEP54_014240 [Fusarium duplospermum]